jgi:hypothetical protein
MPPKQTPYFLFCNEARDSARVEFAKHGIPNPTGAAVAKVLGEKWKGLSEDEKTVRAGRREDTCVGVYI